MKEFEKELSKYASGKGSVQFPNDEPLPLSLITKIVKFRLKENLEKAQGTRNKAQGRTKKKDARSKQRTKAA
jgi:uncharacterized protein YdhG (YjbR/CyaY superfamily)